MAADGLNREKVDMKWLEDIKSQTARAAEEFFETARMKAGQILVVGCSSSEIAAQKIGSFSSAEIGEAVFEVLYEACQKRGIYLAAQCCEHLNRALILEEEAALKYGYEQVNVMPRLKAGGSFATAAWTGMTAHQKTPVAVEKIAANGGIDIGDTLIGMHLKAVAVPVRTSVGQIGAAHVVYARVRPKFVGGGRACYDEALM